jgi:hypothetical protein
MSCVWLVCFERAQVKRAILSSLGIIIDKGGVLLRPFLPQLQPTFVKALNDANKVRRRQRTALPDARGGCACGVLPRG